MAVPARLLCLLAVAALALAGCSGKSAAPAPSPGGSGSAGPGDAAAIAAAPTWTLGQSWTLESPQGGTFTHVVSKDAGDDWILDTDNPDIAFFDARSDISFLGKVRKSDLAGSQGSARVEFLHFPLRAHDNWTTVWDGKPTVVHVLSVQEGKATLHAARASSGAAYADYTYDAAAGYFSHFGFYDAAGKAIAFEWSLRQAGQGFSGSLVRWRLDEVVNVTGPIPSTGANSRTFTVPGGLTDLWVQASINCTAGAVVADVGPMAGPAQDRGFSANSNCPLQETDGYSISAPAMDETWGQMVTAAPTTAGTLDLHLWQRIQVSFAVGQAP